MESRAHDEDELHQMPVLDGFGGLQESSMMKLLTSGMDDFPPLESKVSKETKRHTQCLRNHSAGAGGHAIDGCGEFMPGGFEKSFDAFKCAACGCHRNFHSREEDKDFGASEGNLGCGAAAAADLLKSSKPRLVTSSGGVIGMDDLRLSEAKVQTTTKYLECRRNHIVLAGGLAVDGCQEFIARGENGTLDALKCAACECHRSFHRREVEGEPSCECRQNRSRSKGTTWTSGAIPYTLSYGPTDSDDQDGGSSASAGAKKKRFRTKFSAEQVEKMRSFAEKLGWTIQKNDEGVAQAFCAVIGVSQKLFRVWMHNNKTKRTR